MYYFLLNKAIKKRLILIIENEDLPLMDSIILHFKRYKIMIKRKDFFEFSLSRSLQIGILIFVIIFILRMIEIFILRLDEIWGEVFVSKLLGFLIIIGYLWIVKRKPRDIGFHTNHLLKSISIAFVVMALSILLSYLAEWIYLARKGMEVSLIFAPLSYSLDAEYAIKGGLLFGLWLFFGNVMNSLMEEGLFRGVMVTHFRGGLSFWKANILQAFLFGIWHIVWPIKSYAMNQMNAQEAIIVSIGYIFSSGIIALVWGYLFLKTGSLWAPWLAHTLSNSVMNLLHTVTPQGYDTGFLLRMSILPLIALLTLPIIDWMAKKYQLSGLKKWNTSNSEILTEEIKTT